MIRNLNRTASPSGMAPPGAISRQDALGLVVANPPLEGLMRAAAALTIRGFGRRMTYSRKVFIPLTQLCRDVCHYCTFAGPPRKGASAFLTPEQVIAIAVQGAAAGCREALFTLGDKPELRYKAARDQLAELGFSTTLEYLEHCARLVHAKTGLLPHLNAGILDSGDIARLRQVSVSMGLMLETAADRLSSPGGPHHRSPDKQPAVRLRTIELAGEARVPFTTGLLIGIGETRLERIESLLALRELQQRHGHIQDLIIQNFRAKPGTRMARAAEPPLDELLWTVAVARLVFGPTMSIQAPPNLSPGSLHRLIAAGINDWGGVSPTTPDHVNPEAPWPHLDVLERDTAAADRWLCERLAVTPRYAIEPQRWIDPAMRAAVLHEIDASGYAREREWHAGAGKPPPVRVLEQILSAGTGGRTPDFVAGPLARALAGKRLVAEDIAELFTAAGDDFVAIVRAADTLREKVCGNTVTYVVNRNINYTNICTYTCAFCAFAKSRSARSLRGPGYDMDLEEIQLRVAEAVQRGATEVCMQGGIHPRYTGETYLQILRAARRADPRIHVHAFSPLEVTHGAETLDVSLEDYLAELKAAGLRSLPGTAAEILCDDIREIICPDKVSTAQWLQVMRTAHRLGIRSTATIMFGHVERPIHWARHLLAIRDLQQETGGFTEFVPLPFVHAEAPMWRKGLARSGPSFREAVLMHAIARIVLHPLVPNIQASWVKLGPNGAAAMLSAGANDLGGVLMNESITRAAGGVHGQELNATAMQALIVAAGKQPLQRTTLYGPLSESGMALAAVSAASATLADR